MNDFLKLLAKKILNIVRKNKACNDAYLFLKLSVIEKKAKKQLIKDKTDIGNEGESYLIISGLGMEMIGLFCCMEAYIKWVQYADLNGYIPVIDMENVPSQYIDTKDIGKINAWEYYFCPMHESADAVKEALISGKYKVVNRLDKPIWMSKREFNKLLSTGYKDDLYKRYFRLSEDAQEYIANKRRELFSEHDKICGCLCRGTDYLKLKPHGHSIQPDIEMIRKKISEVCSDYQCNKIYIATEDESILNELKDTYGSILVYLNCDRITVADNEMAAEVFEKKQVDKRMNGMNYLTTIKLLSECDCVIAGKTSATRFIRLMRESNKDFDYYFEWDLGKYD